MLDLTKSVERKVYSLEFKAAAIRLVLEHGYTCDAAAQLRAFCSNPVKALHTLHRKVTEN